ncbi:MAG: signal peptidase I [Clostridiaceae bacterium]|jgi:signal peptidase I|nr:signal peptidase I [Clostridiaceae bacterium]
MQSIENNELSNNEADLNEGNSKHIIRSSKLKGQSQNMSSSPVLRDEEAGEALFEAFGEQERKLDIALKKSLGLDDNVGMKAKKDRQPVSRLRSVLSFMLTLAICVVFALLFTRFVLQRNTVKGISMEPTLLEKDELFVDKISHLWRDYDRFELVTATTDKRTVDGKAMVVIKRIIGLPGEKIEISEGAVFINDVELAEPYLDDSVLTYVLADSSLEVTLAEDEYFLLGDNRPDSFDSRHFGPVKEADLIGRVWIRFYPFDRFGKP